MRKLFIILSILIFLSGVHLIYKAIALSNMVLDGSGVGTRLFLVFEMEIDNTDIPATVLTWQKTSIYLFAISLLFFVLSRILPKAWQVKS